MRQIPIEPVPNQELSINVDGVRWTLRLKVAKTTMIADVLQNDTPIVVGQRICVGTPIIPYRYLAGRGNFIFLTDNEELPDYTQFGVTQQLIYTLPGEL